MLHALPLQSWETDSDGLMGAMRQHCVGLACMQELPAAKKLMACCRVCGQTWHCVQMQFTLTRDTPVSRYWKPKLVFTGTSIMGVNPANGARLFWHTLPPSSPQ